jgi:hypothetical protein
MLLLEDDVQRIVGLGFNEDSFAAESNGFKILRNSNSGRCVFHDGKQCTIYSNRPAGCRLYPIIFDEDLHHPVKDGLCPYRDEFDLSSKIKRELSDVYLKLTDERKGGSSMRRGRATSRWILGSDLSTLMDSKDPCHFVLVLGGPGGIRT